MAETLLRLAEGLKQQGRDNVTAFWLKHSIDQEYGGYWTDLARDGSRYGQGEKWIIVQTRTFYSFCIAYQWFGDSVYLERAAQGVDFFRKHFRDQKNGGFFFCVSRDGKEVLDSTKQPYGLAFASYALAEYARLSGDQGALEDAAETHELVMEKCWDKQYGGLPNRFSPDWQLIEGIKRVDTHMHTMEGVSALYHATGDARHLERLNLLANTILGRIGVDGCYDAEHGCTHEMFHMNWSEALEFTKGLTNYGHVTEAGWFISKLAAYTGDRRQAQLAKGLVDWAIRYGTDPIIGGQHNYGEPTGRVVRPEKVWWNQAELLGALAFLYRLTGDGTYLTHLEKQIDFLNKYMVDHEYGDWYPMLNVDGSIHQGERGRADYKGSRSKSFYHVIQGLYHPYHDLLRAAGKETVREPKQWADLCL